MSFQQNTNISLRPPKKVLNDIMRCLDPKEAKPELPDPAYHTSRDQKIKRIEYSQLREKDKPLPLIRIRKKTITDPEIEDFQRKNNQKSASKERVAIPLENAMKHFETLNSARTKRSAEDMTDYSEEKEKEKEYKDNRLIMPSPPFKNEHKSPNYIIQNNVSYNIFHKQEEPKEVKKVTNRKKKLKRKISKAKKSRNAVMRLRTDKFIDNTTPVTMTKKSLLFDDHTTGNSSLIHKFEPSTTQNSQG